MKSKSQFSVQYISVMIVLAIACASLVALHPSPTYAATSMEYLVGLGDSRAAGAGLPQYETGTNRNNQYDTACKRSPYASINYLAEATSTPVINVACSGATTDDVYESSRVNGSRVPSQISQIPAFVLTDPDTTFVVQTGANDIGWAAWLLRCSRATCGGRLDSASTKILLLNYERRLNRLISTLRSAGASGHIIVTGVYNPLPEVSTLAKYDVTRAEANWIGSVIDTFNQKTAKVASQTANTSYAPIDLDNTDLQSLSDTMPFHPTIQGQQAISRQLLPVVSQQ